MEEENLCGNCTKCCEYVAVEIDEPETEKDFDEVRWFLLHKNVRVFVDNDDDWYIEFLTPCEKLSEKGCLIYEKRPEICREHSMENCEMLGEGSPYKLLFECLEDLEKWISDGKKIPEND